MLDLVSRRDSSNSGGGAWANFKLWHYTPSIAAAIIFAILFISLTAYHTFKLFRNRTWFCIPFVVGGLLESIGYIGRAVAKSNIDSVLIYSIQSLCLLLAPILFAASVYMILGRITRAVNAEQYSFIRVNWVTKIFVGGDIFCFMIQGAGGGLLATAKTSEQINRYSNIILGGLILQILTFMLFLVVALVFQARLQKRPTPTSLDGPLGENQVSRDGRLGRLTWKKLMVGLYLTSILITLRNLFRVIEYAMGFDSYLLDHEWPLYVFDGLLMVCVLIFGIMWYNPTISKGRQQRINMEAHTMETGPVKEEREVPVTQATSNRVRPWT